MRRLALLCVLASCSEPVTELVVVVDSSLPVGALDSIEIEVDGTALGADRVLRQVRVDARTELPLVLSVRHRGGALGIVDIEARGSRAGVVRVRQRTETSFIRRRSLVVYLSLDASCLGEDCRGSETCRAGQCRTARIDPRDLPEWPDLGRAEEPDAFVPMDAAPDAPLLDASLPDAPLLDASLPDATLLDAGHCVLVCDGPDKCKCASGCDSCTLRCSPGAECDDIECRTACVIESRDADFVDVRCDGERCDVDARGTDTVEVDCHRGLCEVDCTDVDDCSVDCGARMCAVRCEECDVRCDDTAETCGGVTYCGYPAPCDP